MRPAKQLKIFSAAALAVLLLLAPCASAQRRRARAARRASVPPRATAPVVQRPAARGQRQPAQTPPAAAGTRQQPARTAPTPVTREAQEERGAAEIDRPLEEIVAAEGYALYVELRALGQLVRSKDVTELIELVRLVGGEARQVSDYIDFYVANAEQLNDVSAHALLMPARAGLPQFVGAYQFPSAEAAKSFEPKARAVMNNYERAYREVFTTPHPALPPGAPAEAGKPGARPAPPAPQLVVKRYGRLILVSGEPFTLKSLKGKDEPPLAHNSRFQSLRGRLSSEPVFLYFDVKLLDRSEAIDQERREQAQKQQEESGQGATAAAAAEAAARERQFQEEMARAEAEARMAAEVAAAGGSPEEGEEVGGDDSEMGDYGSGVREVAEPATVASEMPTTPGGPAGEGQAGGEGDVAQRRGGEFMMSMLFGMGVSGASRWPEAVGAALALERDTIIVRALLINTSGGQVHPVPFLPVLVSGAQFTPQAASVAPAGTDIYVSASLDLTQMYDRMLASMEESFSREAQAREAAGEKLSDEHGGKEATIGEKISDERGGKAAATILAAEKLMGFKVREDFLPALGGEVAVSVPLKWLTGESGYNYGYRPEAREERQGAVALVSLNNAEAMRRMLPRVLEVVGLKPLTAKEQRISHGGVDIHVYGSLAIAYVGNFMALSWEVPAMKRLIDAASAQGALASDEQFRAATSWSPRQKLAEVYVSRVLTDHLLAEVTKWVDPKDAEVQQLLARLNIRPAPASYAVTDEGGMLLHELRLPTAVVKYFAAEEALRQKSAPIKQGENSALSTLTTIRYMQQAHKGGKGKGSYATLEELSALDTRPRAMAMRGGEHPLSKDALEKLGYSFELTAAGDKYAVTATPREFGRNGRRSFYMDETGIIRASVRAGAPATANDPPVD